MHIIELDKLKKARVSFEEIPELVNVNQKKTETYVIATGNTINEKRTVTLELMLPSDACYYALLGAKYIPIDEYEGIRLGVRYSDNESENYMDTLAYSSRTVFKGLSKEYAETVLSTASDFLQSIDAPKGKIVFDAAVYCDVGSSLIMFRIVTKIVLHILLKEQHPVFDSDIKVICEKYLLERSKP